MRNGFNFPARRIGSAGLCFWMAASSLALPNELQSQSKPKVTSRAVRRATNNSAVKFPSPSTDWRLVETANMLEVVTRDYTMRIARDGFAFDLTRGGGVAFATAQAGDQQQNLSFVRGGRVERPSALSDFRREGDALTLMYTTTTNAVSARVEIRPMIKAVRVVVRLVSERYDIAPSFRFRLEPSGQWWGGASQGWRKPHAYPLNSARLEREGFLMDSTSQGSPIWFGTKGVGVWIRTSRDFRYSVNKQIDGRDDGLISVEMPHTSVLEYDILVDENLPAVVRRIVREIGYPKVVPPFEFFRMPVYTTWVEHKADVTQEKVIEYARKIRADKLPAGVIEIDDKWEDKYGDLEFDRSKFPDPKAIVDELRRMNFKVTLWVHPYVNLDSEAYRRHRRDGFLLRDSSGDAGITKWWNGACAVWDLTNPKVASGFRGKLTALQKKYGFDGFKFDGGDVHRVPQDLRAVRNITPAEYADVYNEAATKYFAWNETRVGVYSQPTGVVQRLIDKHSVWGMENGLGSLIPETIINGLRGWPYVMPDMVGGNEYDKDRIDAELLIRWAQASALMPLLQFSKGPWHFGEDAVEISREMSELHIRFAPYIYELAQKAPRTGEPILSGLFYHAPVDAETFKIADQFMLGPDVVVAPVLGKGAVSRDIYLPAGDWRDLKTGATIKGNQWLKDHPAPLEVLPVFVRVGSRAARL